MKIDDVQVNFINIPQIKKQKQILDYIHGMIKIKSFFFKFIDTPQFQRLRELYQLSCSQFVYPNANHNRFEHSIGTFYLTSKYITSLLQNNPNLKMPQSLINSISLCSLCHNLGHGPYGEPFDSFCSQLGIPFNSHEMSVKIFENIIDKEAIDTNAQNEEENFDIEITKKLISQRGKSEHFYEQIVTNTKNGIDADIFDSLSRDVYKVGFPNQSFDYEILMNNAYVIEDEICFRQKDAYSIYDLFMSKYLMSKQLYLHRVSKGIELMIKDVFLESNAYYNYSDIINNVNSFVDLTDHIIWEISHSKTSKLNKAREILYNIYHRKCYSFTGEYDSSNSVSYFEKFNDETLLNYTSADEVPLNRGDIRIMKMKLNLGIDENDPITNVSFYDTEYKKVKVERKKISQLLPDKFQERIIRVYITTKDDKKISAAQQALLNFCKENGTTPMLYKSSKKMQGVKDFVIDKSFPIKKSVDLFN